MDDLLSQFEQLRRRYVRATEMHQSARTADGIRDARRFLSNEAIELCDFLIEHAATVTFGQQPAQRDAAESATPTITPDLGYRWDAERRNWFPITGADSDV